MNGKVFVDTNILIYAHDRDAGEKHAAAARVLKELWRGRAGVLSTQVLQEFYVNVTRKIPSPLPRAVARHVVQQYSAWPVVGIDVDLIGKASEMEERHRIFFWDALIVVAARRAGASRVLSEDLNAGQEIDGVLIENPLPH
ncbi:MAG: PIN domain-containing protein [Deferrisomatales bacterium]|nr:PIN domain-containing protein [Deferrisomatales bacterium]